MQYILYNKTNNEQTVPLGIDEALAAYCLFNFLELRVSEYSNSCFMLQFKCKNLGTFWFNSNYTCKAVSKNVAEIVLKSKFLDYLCAHELEIINIREDSNE